MGCSTLEAALALKICSAFALALSSNRLPALAWSTPAHRYFLLHCSSRSKRSAEGGGGGTRGTGGSFLAGQRSAQACSSFGLSHYRRARESRGAQ